MTLKNIILCLIFFAAFNSIAAPLTVGAGVAVSSSPYKYKDKTTYDPLPLLSYYGDDFYIDGPEFGLNIFKNEQQQLTLIASYDLHHFDPKYAIDSLKKVSKRNATLFSGVGYTLYTSVGDFTTTVLQDTLGKSKGMKINAEWSTMTDFNQWSLGYVAGVEWNSKKQNRYYYGLDKNESLKSGVVMYEPKSSLTPYTGFTVAYAFNPEWVAILFANAYFTPEEQKKSPLSSGKSVAYTSGIAVSYSF